MSDLSLLITYAIGVILGIVITIVLIRAILGIPSIIRYHKKQYLLLREMALKLGVDESRIVDIDNPEPYKRDEAIAELKKRKA